LEKKKLKPVKRTQVMIEKRGTKWLYKAKKLQQEICAFLEKDCTVVRKLEVLRMED
jgi:hypothetical protein